MPAFAGPAPAASARQPQLAKYVVHKPVRRSFGGIPPLIKRNTVLFALSQSFVGAGTQLAYGIGPLMVIAVTGSASLAGLTVGLFGVSRFLVVLSGRQDHRSLRPQARHPVRPGRWR